MAMLGCIISPFYPIFFNNLPQSYNYTIIASNAMVKKCRNKS